MSKFIPAQLLLCCSLVGAAFAAPLQSPERGAASTEMARQWDRGFLSGNGTQGAIYYGAPGRELVTLNHALLFLPLGNKAVVPQLGDKLPELRRRIGEQGHDKAMLWWMEQAKPFGYTGLLNTDPFHPGLELELLTQPVGSVRDYLRTEDFATGEVSVRWSDDRGEFQRQLFVSRPDNVVVLRLRGEGPKAPLVDADLRIPGVGDARVRAYTQDHQLDAASPEAAANVLIQSQLCVDADGLRLENAYKYPSPEYGHDGYDAALRVIVRGGSVKPGERLLSVRGAEEILVIARIEPRRKLAPGSSQELRRQLDALPGDYAALLAPHARVHGDLFSRVTVDFGGAKERTQTTDALLARSVATKEIPPALLEKIYDGSRYVILSASGIRPPNLQGIWTGTWQPAWSGDYTTNTNLQLAIAHHFSCGTPELLDGYFKLIEQSLPDWRLNAKGLFGARGVVAPTRQSTHAKNIHWSNRFHGSYWTPGAGWLAHWFQEHFAYTGDRRFLAERTVPLLKEIALFYEDFLYAGPDGRLLFRPSKSAENGSNDNSTQDIMVAREVLTNLIADCRLLGTDLDQIPKWKGLLERLPSYQVDPETGELLEWSFVGAKNRNFHRHMSHLYALFQSYEFDPVRDPALWTASEKAYEARLNQWLRKADPKDNNSQSSHGRMHMGLIAARLGRGAEVGEILNLMAASGAIHPSMATAHYERGRTFNMDANGGMPEIINNSLLFCWEGTLQILPALPPQMKSGCVKGLRLRGGLIAEELSWDEKSVGLTLRSQKAQTLRIEGPRVGSKAWRPASGPPDGGSGVRTIDLPAGVSMSLTFSRGQ